MRRMLVVLLALSALPGGLPAGPLEATEPGLPGPDRPDPESTLDFGFALQMNRPYPEPGGRVKATLFFFNLTPYDADGAWADWGGLGCRYDLLVKDARGRTVWQPRVPCPEEDISGEIAPVGPFPFPAGSLLKLPVDLRMVYRASETLDPDGEPLPGGPYSLVAHHDYSGPVIPEPGMYTGGGIPRAEVPFRIVHCYGEGGPMPMRELVRESHSGYGLGRPDFHGEDLVLRTEEAGLAFWAEHVSNREPAPAPPFVDFRTEMVVVSLLGPRATTGPSVRIMGVEEYPCHILVQVLHDLRPGQLPATSNPIHAVAVPRSLKEVVFIHAVPH